MRETELTKYENPRSFATYQWWIDYKVHNREIKRSEI